MVTSDVACSAHLRRAAGEVSDSHTKPLALDGGNPLVVVVGHEVTVDARL